VTAINITDLTAATAVTGDDLVVVVDDVAGTPTTKKITADNVVASAVFTDAFAVKAEGIIACTSATRPTGVEGRRIYETDTDLEQAYDGSTWVEMGRTGAWTSWTPTVTQSGTVTTTNTRSRYVRYGRTIHFSVDLSVTGSGTGSNPVLVSLPATAAASAQMVAGTGNIGDSSAATDYVGSPYLNSTAAVGLLNSSGAYLGNATFTAGLASGDRIRISGTYEAAS
jgi:hypothetical protein